MRSPALDRLIGRKLKDAVLDLFRNKPDEALSDFTIWSHFQNPDCGHAPTPAVVNAVLFTLVDEGRLYSFRLPGRETFFDKGTAYYRRVDADATTTEGRG